MTATEPHIMIIAGEASGDLHGARLVREILKRNPSVKFSGMGGNLMKEAGVECIANIEETGVVGLWEVLSNVKSVIGTFNRLKSYLREKRPSLLIPVDYPDFNIRMSIKAKNLGIPVIYFISPQLWAWRPKRVNIIQKYIDRMLVILPFEEDFYRKHGLEVTYVGHPLVDKYADLPDRENARKTLGIPDKQTVIALMPGSRKSEIKLLFPLMQETVSILKKSYPDALFVLLLAPTLKRDDLVHAGYRGESIRIHNDSHSEFLAAADIVITASGTATIETALTLTPMVIAYKVSPITYFIGKRIVKTSHIGMVNLIAGKRIVPELLQDDATPRKTADEVINILSNTELRKRIRSDLSDVVSKLGHPGAAGRAADYILDFLQQQSSSMELKA